MDSGDQSALCALRAHIGKEERASMRLWRRQLISCLRAARGLVLRRAAGLARAAAARSGGPALKHA